MDPFLAEFYGTGSSNEEMEKTAQLEMLEKIAEEEGVDLDDLSDEELEYILSDEGEEDDEDDEDLEKEAMEKFAEADFLGRVMAHANWDEMQKIAADDPWYKRAPKAVHRRAMGLGERITGLKGARSGEVGEMVTGKGKTRKAGKAGFAKTRRGAALARMLRSDKARNIAKGVAGYGAPVAGAAALGGAGYAGYRAIKGKKKKSADEIVEQRAAEFLMEAGIDPNEVFEKTAGYTQEDVDTAALQYLEDLGVPVTWYDNE